MSNASFPFPLEKIGSSTLIYWLQEANKKGVKRILVFFYDNHYSPEYLKIDKNEEDAIIDSYRSGDIYSGTIDVEKEEYILESLNK